MKMIKTIHRIWEYFFDRWKWEVVSIQPIDYYSDLFPSTNPCRRTKVITYKLIDKFNGSIKMKTKELQA